MSLVSGHLVELLVGGRLFGGWKRVEVQRSIEQLAGGFVLELTRRWPGQDDLPALPRLREGLPCQVLLDGDVVVSGYIDTFEPELSSSSCSIRVEGRDKTGDLVDCAAVYRGGQWSNARLERIVRDIAAPFGLPVIVQPGLDQGDPFKSFALEDGEKAFDAIDRACRLRAVLCTSTPDGALWLGTAGEVASGATLEEGRNVLRISSTHSWKDRFSKVIVKGQVPGDDDQYGASASQLKAQALDPEIDRYRPLVVMAEHGTSNASLRERAEWEISVRMGRGKRGRVSVVGWRTGQDGRAGPLWLPNTLVRVISPTMQLDGDMLIVAAAFTLTEGGAITELTFCLPEAFEQVEGAGRSKLKGRLNGRLRRRRKKDEDGFTASWERDPPKPAKGGDR